MKTFFSRLGSLFLDVLAIAIAGVFWTVAALTTWDRPGKPSAYAWVVIACLILLAAINALFFCALVDQRNEAAYLRKSEAEAWSAYHELRATHGAMEVF